MTKYAEALPNVDKLAHASPLKSEEWSHLTKDRIGDGHTYYIPRAAWAKKPDMAKMDKETAAYTAITLHHTASELTPWDTEALHRGGQNWWRDPYTYLRDNSEFLTRHLKKRPHYEDADVGYHYFISSNGDIYEGRSLNYIGAHVEHHNPDNIGIAVAGDYTDKPLNDKQVHSLALLVGALERVYDIKTVRTHGQWDPVKKGELQGALPQIGGLLKESPGS